MHRKQLTYSSIRKHLILTLFIRKLRTAFLYFYIAANLIVR